MASGPVRPLPSPGQPRRYALSRPAAFALVVAWLIATWAFTVCFMSDQKTSGSWGCEMSYMTPSYYQVDWKENSVPRYSLHLYREAGFDPETPSGQPVIFVPGNAGSFKQVRSIASSASRQYYSHAGKPWGRPLDFFAVDFNEDLSALHAPTLQEQGEFLASAIPRVLRAYDHLPDSQRPTHVTLLGHSMGGIVARLAATMADFGTIDAIITMSTPHSQPPVALQAGMQSLYGKINVARAATQTQDGPGPLLVSICGGQSDTQIISDSCALPGSLISPDDGFAVFTTGMPGVWTGVEHQAMVWCHQVRWRVARALLDMSTGSSREAKLDSARHWLLGPSSLHASTALPDLEAYKLDIQSANRSIIVQIPGASEATQADPPIQVQYCRDDRTCVGQKVSVEVIPWLFDASKPFPSSGEGSKPEESAFVLDLEQGLEGFTYIEVMAPRGAIISAGSYDQVRVKGSRWETQATEHTKSHIDLLFDRSFLSSIAVWRVQFEIGECSAPHPVAQYKVQPVAGLKDTTTESRSFPIRDGVPVLLHSHISGSPFQSGSQTATGINVHIYEHPHCQVRSATISFDVQGSLAKAILRFRIAINAWSAGWIAVVFSLQLAELGRSGHIPSFNKVIMNDGLPAIAAVLASLLGVQFVQSIVESPTEHLSLGYMSLRHAPFMTMAALWTLGVAAFMFNTMLLYISGLGRILDRAVLAPPEEKNKPTLAQAILPRLPPALVLLATVYFFIPAGLALAALLLVSFFTCAGGRLANAQQSQQYLCTSLLGLIAYLLPLHLAEVAVWGKNMWAHGGRSFPSDHSLLHLLPILGFVVLSSVDIKLSAPSPLVVRGARILSQAAAAAMFLIAPQRPYVLGPAINVVFVAACWVLYDSGRRG